MPMSLKGFANLVMGGFRLEKRVLRYWPTDMPW